MYCTALFAASPVDYSIGSRYGSTFDVDDMGGVAGVAGFAEEERAELISHDHEDAAVAGFFDVRLHHAAHGEIDAIG